MGFIAELISIALMIGAQDVYTYLMDKKANKVKMSPSQILNTVTKILDRSVSRGVAIQNKVINKLNSLQYPIGMSSRVKSVISDARRKLNETNDRLSEINDDYARSSNNISNRANALASTSATYRSSKTGRDEINDLTKEAESLNKSYNDKLMEVEKNV